MKKISIKKNAPLVIVISILLLSALSVGIYFLVTQVSDEMNDDDSPELILIGIDGADWNIINPLIQEGKMPNLEYLIDNGVSGTPKTLNPTISPAIWTTVATGKLPNKHGIQNFLATAHDYEFRFVGSDSRTSKALWNIVSDAGMKVGLFGYWATWPPEKINGYVVSDLAALDPKEAIYPPSLATTIITESIKTSGLNLLQGGFNLTLPDPVSPNDESFFKIAKQKLSDLDAIFRATSVKAFDTQDVDIQMQITGVIDAAQHLFLKFHWPERYPEKIPQELLEKYDDFIEELYVNQDKLIGEYLKRAGENTHIIVLSDHGVFIDPATGYRFEQFNSILSQLGYLTFNEDGSINYSKTKAFECNNNTFDWQRRLCINVADKYSNGLVSSDEYQTIKSKLIKDLLTIKTPDGESMFEYVRSSTELNSDIQYDIKRTLIGKLIIVNGVYRTFNEFLNLSIESGNHYANPEGPNGIFVWKGPNIKKGFTVDIDYVDILPNILTAFHMPIGKDMDGKFNEKLFITPPTPQYIETYENGLRKIATTLFDSIEDEDQLLVDHSKITISSKIAEDDVYDNYCFAIPHAHNYALVNTTVESENVKEHAVPHFTKLESLSSYAQSVIPFTEIIFPASKKETYNLLSPLDLHKPTELGIWTNTSFSFSVPEEGYLTIVARGELVDSNGPLLTVKTGTQSMDLNINSVNAQAYEIPVSQGLVTVTYNNDAKNDHEDRNGYIQAILFSKEPRKSRDEGLEVVSLQDSFCIMNTLRGEHNFEFLLQDLNQIPNTSEGKEVLELLEYTGDITD